MTSIVRCTISERGPGAYSTQSPFGMQCASTRSSEHGRRILRTSRNLAKSSSKLPARLRRLWPKGCRRLLPRPPIIPSARSRPARPIWRSSSARSRSTLRSRSSPNMPRSLTKALSLSRPSRQTLRQSRQGSFQARRDRHRQGSVRGEHRGAEVKGSRDTSGRRAIAPAGGCVIEYCVQAYGNPQDHRRLDIRRAFLFARKPAQDAAENCRINRKAK